MTQKSSQKFSKANCAILCSGELGYFCLKELVKSLNIYIVFTDKKSTDIIDFARSSNILLFVGNPRTHKEIHSIIKTHVVDYLISVNYLFLIEKNLIEWPKRLAFNLHGSLLPKYRGRAPHIWAIINGEEYTGITAHLIDENCDTGDILLQKKIIITESTTGGDLLKIFKQNYPRMVLNVIRKDENGCLNPIMQNENEATFYGKRTPKDGIINWFWDSKKIERWIKALTFPYPGAFTYIKGKKVIIDEAILIDKEYDANGQIGDIISINPIRVLSREGIFEVTKKRELNENR